MNVVIIILAVAFIVGDIAGLFLLARRFGTFAPIQARTETVPALWIAYNTHSGPYQLIGPVCDGVCRELNEVLGITAKQGFGLYFDNPRRVAKDQLRSLGGCVVPEDKAAGLAGSTLPFRMALLPGGQAVVVRFPYRGRVSIMVGAMRVYPAMQKHFTAAGVPEGPVMEIYDMAANEIRYVRLLDVPNGELERLL